MDSFSEPRKITEYSLEDVQSQVSKLEADHRAKGIPLSGRIIHVAHYLPVTCALSSQISNGVNGHSNGSQPSIPSPPQTPPAKASDIPPSPTQEGPAAPKSKWQLSSRYGHSAMVSGVTSLTATHEQVLIGWTGDVQSLTRSENESSKVPSDSISQEDRADLENLLSSGKHLLKEDFPEGKSMTYVPVWLDDKQAHGHYDGYCKQSESPSYIFSSLFPFLALSANTSLFSLPSLAPLEISRRICHAQPLASCRYLCFLFHHLDRRSKSPALSSHSLYSASAPLPRFSSICLQWMLLGRFTILTAIDIHLSIPCTCLVDSNTHVEYAQLTTFHVIDSTVAVVPLPSLARRRN